MVLSLFLAVEEGPGPRDRLQRNRPLSVNSITTMTDSVVVKKIKKMKSRQLSIPDLEGYAGRRITPKTRRLQLTQRPVTSRLFEGQRRGQLTRTAPRSATV